MEEVFGDGREPAVRRQAAGRRIDERGLPGVRYLARPATRSLPAIRIKGLKRSAIGRGVPPDMKVPDLFGRL